MVLRRLIVASFVAVVSAMALRVSALAKYTSTGGTTTLPNTGAGTAERIASDAPMVAIAVLALALVAMAVGTVARRYRAG